MSKYLDWNGLQNYDSKLKAYFPNGYSNGNILNNTDWNNLTTPGVYLSNSANSYSHTPFTDDTPATGVKGTLVVIKPFPTTDSHINLTQILFSNDPAAIIYRSLSATDGWLGWKYIDSRFNGVIGDASYAGTTIDANTLTDPGVYRIAEKSGVTYNNTPMKDSTYVKWGILTVEKAVYNENVIIQTWIQGGPTYSRCWRRICINAQHTDKPWSPWFKYLNENDIDLSLYATLASPALTGTPTAPTADSNTNNTQIATTAFVKTALSSYAKKSSPALTGTPTAPTAAAGTNTTQIATTAFVQEAIGSITGISYEVVQTRPETGAAGTIYLVPNSGSGLNIYDEYIWVSSLSKFEKIGSTETDLSGYWKTSGTAANSLIAITNGEIDGLFTS